MKKIFLIIILFTSINFAQSNFGILGVLMGDDGGYTINANAQMYFDSLTTPLADSIQIFLSETLDALDDSLNGGLRNKTLAQLGFDRLWLLGNQTQEAANRDIAARINLTAVNTPTFTQWYGYTSAATGTKYLNTNYNPTTHGVNYTLVNASASIYIRTTRASSSFSKIEFGSTVAATNKLALNSYATTGAGTIRIEFSVNSLSTGIANYTDSTSGIGYFTANRMDTSKHYALFNADSIASGAHSATAIPTNAIFIGATNTNGSPTNTTEGQYSIFWIGKGFSEADHRKIYNCLKAKWLDRIGASAY